MDTKRKMELAGSEDIQKEIERFFTHVGRWKRPVFFFEKAWKPLCDVSETETEVMVVADLSGVSTENVSIKVEGDNLIIRGVRREPQSHTDRNFHLMEISYGPFERVVLLPCRIDAKSASANFKEGFLEIRLPKVSKEPPKEVDVNAS